MPDQEVYNRIWAQNRQKGFGTAQTNVKPLFNVDAPETWTGMNNSTGGSYNPAGGNKLETFVNGVKRVFSPTEDMIKSLGTTGGKGQVNGIAWEMTPEQKAFYEATLPMYQYHGFDITKQPERITQQVSDNVTKLVKDRSIMEAAGGYRQWYDNIQKGNNQQYQIAQAEMQSKDPEVVARGKQRMEMVANAQYVLNKSMPQVTQGIQQGIRNKVNQIKNFAGNNWWWMLPAGGALLYGLGNLFGRGNVQNPQGDQTPMPSYWKTGFQQTPAQQQAPVPQPQQVLPFG